jgi:hypothetical protein
VKPVGARLSAYPCDACGLYFKPAGISRPLEKSLRCMRQIELAWVAQLVERVLGKDEVTGSIPVPGSRGRGCGLYFYAERVK